MWFSITNSRLLFETVDVWSYVLPTERYFDMSIKLKSTFCEKTFFNKSKKIKVVCQQRVYHLDLRGWHVPCRPHWIFHPLLADDFLKRIFWKIKRQTLELFYLCEDPPCAADVERNVSIQRITNGKFYFISPDVMDFTDTMYWWYNKWFGTLC